MGRHGRGHGGGGGGGGGNKPQQQQPSQQQQQTKNSDGKATAQPIHQGHHSSSLLALLSAAASNGAASSANNNNNNSSNDKAHMGGGGGGNGHLGGSRGGNVPTWKNDLLHVWRKDSITVINMRVETEVLPGIELLMRQETAKHATLLAAAQALGHHHQASEALRPKDAAVSDIPLPRNAAAIPVAAMRPLRDNPPSVGGPHDDPVSGPPPKGNLQSFLNDQLTRMRQLEKQQQSQQQQPLSDASFPLKVSSEGPALRADGTRVTPQASPLPAPVSLFSDPLWAAGSSWDTFDEKPKGSGTASSEPDKLTVDLLSGLLGDLRTEGTGAHQGGGPPNSPPAPVAAVGTKTPPTPAHSPGGAGPWTVAGAGMHSPGPGHTPMAPPQPQMMPAPQQHHQQMSMAAAAQMAAQMKQAAPQGHHQMHQVFMGPNGVPFVAMQPNFQGAPFQGVGGQPIFLTQQGMQMVQAPPGWGMHMQAAPQQQQQQVGKPMMGPMILNFAGQPMPAGNAMTMQQIMALQQQHQQAMQHQHQHQQPHASAVAGANSNMKGPMSMEDYHQRAAAYGILTQQQLQQQQQQLQQQQQQQPQPQPPQQQQPPRTQPGLLSSPFAQNTSSTQSRTSASQSPAAAPVASSPDAVAAGPRNVASANGVNVGAVPFVPGK